MSRIGLLGGSFDPPHLAHLALARGAIAQLRLDELRWLPAGAPWQKAGRAIEDAVHRSAMVAMQIAGEPRMALDERELRRDGPTYSIDTLRELDAEQPNEEWLLLIGQDQYARFDTWRDWREILARVTLAVAARSGKPPLAPPALADMPHRVVALAMPRVDISGSAIRARRAAGLEIASLVGDAVAGYIDRHALYVSQFPPPLPRS
ncbi:MAG: nicotinate (nicotinamide) nucleotide adenylyltransferase [Burkholderiales bacterium]|nr:nicotinate (nicotinamide) nucleotide adenylyltransferase [Burkholderiales bacterium]